MSAELTPLDGKGKDNRHWLAVMDAYGKNDEPRDTFSQSDYLSARYFVRTLMTMDPCLLPIYLLVPR